MLTAKNNIKLEGLILVSICLVLLSGILLALQLLYHLSVKDSIAWFAGIFVYFYIPGNLLLRCITMRSDEFFTNILHSMALGTASLPLFYVFFRKISHPDFAFYFGIAVLLTWMFLNLRDLKLKKMKIVSTLSDLSYLLSLIVLVLCLLHITHFTDVRILKEGILMRNTPLTETVFHLGIINVMKEVYPPFNPYATGLDFSFYHLFMHHEIEMFNRVFSIDTIKLTFFYFPFLYLFLLMAVPYLFVVERFGKRSLGLITSVLMFGSGLSFIPGVLGLLPENYPWTLTFATTVWSIFTLNGNLPALFILILGVLYLNKYFESGDSKFLFVFILLAISSYGFKSSIGPHMIGAVFITGIIAVSVFKDRKRGGLLLAVSALVVIIMVTDIIFFKFNKSDALISIMPLNGFLRSLKVLKWTDAPVVLFPVLFLFYISAMFGMRILGLILMHDMLKRQSRDLMIIFLIIFCVVGFIISEIFYIGDKSRQIDNSVWFLIQSLIAAWLLIPYLLNRIINNGQKYIIMAALIIALSIPTTIHFLSLRFSDDYVYFSPDALSVARYLESTPPESVVIHPSNLREPSLASNLAGRRSVLSVFLSFSSLELGREEFNSRLNDIGLFFRSESNIKRVEILKKYNVNYVYINTKFTSLLDKEQSLQQVFRNKEFTVYKVNLTELNRLSRESAIHDKLFF